MTPPSSRRFAFEAFEVAWLRGVFQRALSAALASSLAAAGCGEANCDGYRPPLELSQLKPAKPFDYASIRLASFGEKSYPVELETGKPQAATARDPEVAALMREIALDETRHAALSQRIARWVTPRLTAAARERVAGARAQAIATLFDEIASNEPGPAIRELAGVPDAATASSLLENLLSDLA